MLGALMTFALNPALIAFVQIVLALLLCYLCIVLIKIFRDATAAPPTRSLHAKAQRSTSASALTRQQS